MALTKVGSGGIENVTSSANATFLTVDASEQITVASEGGAVTTSIQQGIAKAWGANVTDSAVAGDSFNISSISDLGVGDNRPSWSNVFASSDYSAHGNCFHATSPINRTLGIAAMTTSQFDMQGFVADSGNVSSAPHHFTCSGDLA